MPPSCAHRWRRQRRASTASAPPRCASRPRCWSCARPRRRTCCPLVPSEPAVAPAAAPACRPAHSASCLAPATDTIPTRPLQRPRPRPSRTASCGSPRPRPAGLHRTPGRRGRRCGSKRPRPRPLLCRRWRPRSTVSRPGGGHHRSLVPGKQGRRNQTSSVAGRTRPQRLRLPCRVTRRRHPATQLGRWGRCSACRAWRRSRRMARRCSRAAGSLRLRRPRSGAQRALPRRLEPTCSRCRRHRPKHAACGPRRATFWVLGPLRGPRLQPSAPHLPSPPPPAPAAWPTLGAGSWRVPLHALRRNGGRRTIRLNCSASWR